MPKYHIKIIETLEKVKIVEAKDKLAAIDKVQALWLDEKIILSGDDFKNVEFDCMNNTKV